MQHILTQVLDDRQLDTGIVHQGDMARVRSFMHKLRHQQPVHIGEDCQSWRIHTI